LSFSFIDDKNKILDIDPSQNYYLAGKNQDVLFISKTFNISDGIITFDVDTYTEPFLNEVQKRNTEIQIELGYNTLGVQKVLLRDYAFAQPRVYIEGLNPSKVNFSEYYTIEEVDSLLANIDVNVSLDNYYTKAEVDEKISEPTDLSNYYTKDQVDNLIPEIPEIPEVPTKVSELENDSGFISGYTENDPIYTADKPNIAMKSDLFSKSYNDLTDKPEIFTPTKNGDGSKYLADDGTYKKIEGGGGSSGETVVGEIFSNPQFLYLNNYTYNSSTRKYTWILDTEIPTSAKDIGGFTVTSHKDMETPYCEMKYIFQMSNNYSILKCDRLTMKAPLPRQSNRSEKIIGKLYFNDVLYRTGEVIFNDEYYSNFIGIPLDQIIKSDDILGEGELKIIVEYYYYQSIPYEANQGNYYIPYNTIHTNKKWNETYMNVIGLAKNIDVYSYHLPPNQRDIQSKLESFNSEIQQRAMRCQRELLYGGSFDNNLYENRVYYMPSDYYTSSLNIYGFENDSMIMFNTDPENDFSYSFSVDSGWKINKPFAFEKGKSYVIATEANCIFWCEVQNYE
jgi:hypothetical protein